MVTAKLVKELRELTGAGMMDCKKALEATDGNIQDAVNWLREKGVASAQKKAGRIAAEGSTNVLVSGDKGIVIELNSETDFVAKNETFVELVKKLSEVILENEPATLEDALAIEIDGMTVNDAVINATATIGEKISLRRFEIAKKGDNAIFGEYVHMGGKIGALTVIEGGNPELAKDIAMQVASMAPQYVSREDIPSDIIEKEKAIQIEILKNDESLANKPEKVLEGIVEGRVSKTFQEVTLLDQPFFKDSAKKVSQVLKENNATMVTFVRYALGEGIEKKEEDFAAEVAKAAQI